MLLRPQPSRNAFLHALGAGAGALALATAAPLAAQEGAATGAGTVEEPEGESPTDLPAPPEAVIVAQSELDPPPAAEFNAAGERQIAFASDILSYDSDADIVTAEGNVVLRSGERSVRADSVSWSRRTGVILATGNVRFVDDNGNQLFSDQVELTDEFEAGALENLLLALRQGGRLAARRGLRETDGTISLQEAAYSACAVVTPEGCDKDPSWRITADRVIYDPQDSRVRFQGA